VEGAYALILRRATAMANLPFRANKKAHRLVGSPAHGRADLRRDVLTTTAAPGTRLRSRRKAAGLEVESRQVPTRHEITVLQVRRWCESTAVNPEERLRRTE
jgi:hypothetical protein